MKIKVEACWNGTADGDYFRLLLPNGSRERVTGARWTRDVAIRAKDIIEYLYGIERDTIRFEHK